MLKKLFILLFAFGFKVALCQSIKPLWSNLDTLSTVDTIGFSSFTENELKRMDYFVNPDSITRSLLGDSIKFNVEDDFLNKRSRIKIFHNNKLVQFSDIREEFLPGICEGWQEEDTISIITGI